MAQNVEELKVWQRANELCDAVDAILDRPRLVADRRLRDQIRDAADSMISNIAEASSSPRIGHLRSTCTSRRAQPPNSAPGFIEPAADVTSKTTSTSPAKPWRTKSVRCSRG